MRAVAWIAFVPLLVWAPVAAAGVEVLERFAAPRPVANSSAQPLRVELLTIDRPGVDRPRWALRGRVRCAGVQGQGFLEMWSDLGEHGRFFSRTLGRSGPAAALSGDQDWRPFLLPFQSEPDGPRPESLELGVVLPGPGKVWLDEVELVQYDPGDDPLDGAAVAGRWLSPRQGGWIGALGGTAFGLIGALIGVLAALGRARRLALGLLGSLLICGLAAGVVGALALVRDQPWPVAFPFLLLAAVGTFVPLVALPGVRRRYRQIETRRMQALDAG